MKGKLYRKTEGWMVFYVEKNSAYTSTSYQKSLPLHPENESIFITYTDYSVDWDGKEVDFEIVNESWDGYKGCIYAKLINHISDISKMVEDDVEKLALEWFVTADKRGIYFDLGWCKIFIAGYNKAKETLYTEEQVMEAIEKTLIVLPFINVKNVTDTIIQSLKQPK